MHASIWHFAGDPQQLLDSYEAMVAELPAANMRLHCAGTTDAGLVIVDTCPSKEVFDGFFAGEGFAELRRRHGLPDPTAVEDFPLTTVFVDGQRRSSAS